MFNYFQFSSVPQTTIRLSDSPQLAIHSGTPASRIPEPLSPSRPARSNTRAHARDAFKSLLPRASVACRPVRLFPSRQICGGPEVPQGHRKATALRPLARPPARPPAVRASGVPQTCLRRRRLSVEGGCCGRAARGLVLLQLGDETLARLVRVRVGLRVRVRVRVRARHCLGRPSPCWSPSYSFPSP